MVKLTQSEQGGHIPSTQKESVELPDESFGFEKEGDLFPTTLVDGSLTNGGDARMFQIKSHHAVPKNPATLVIMSNLYAGQEASVERWSDLTVRS